MAFGRGAAARTRREAVAEPRLEPAFVPPVADLTPPPHVEFEPPRVRRAPAQPEGGAMIPIAEFLLRARQLGIMDRRILAALESIPRQPFLDGGARSGPLYAERPQPIACGQLSTPPIVVARLLTALSPGEHDRVLEIGTGTGYLAAVMSRLVRRVYTVDRFRTLLAAAEARFVSLGVDNVTPVFADGNAGWPDKAPFDVIVSTASAVAVPPRWIEQLATRGALIMPIGPADGEQMLTLFRRSDRSLVETPICPVRLQPKSIWMPCRSGGRSGRGLPSARRRFSR